MGTVTKLRKGLWVGHSLSGLVLAFVLIGIAALWPMRPSKPNLDPKNIQMTVAQTPPVGPGMAQREVELNALRARGFKVGATQITHIVPKAPPTHWWQRFTTVLHAWDVIYQDGGYILITNLDDGNPDNGEMYVYAVAYGGPHGRRRRPMG